MSRNSLTVIAIAAVMILIMSSPASAYWLMDGNELCTDPAGQSLWQCVPDGSGGLIAVWLDQRLSKYTVAMQKIDTTGAVAWNENGIFPAALSSTQSYPSIVPRSNGSAIAIWQDDYWDDPSVAPDTTTIVVEGPWSSIRFVCDLNSTQSEPASGSDGDDGVIIAWVDDRNGYLYKDIYAQRLSGSDGSRLWTSSGIAVCTQTGDQSSPRIIPDGSGGAVVVWEDHRSGGSDIYAQRLDPLGTALWTPGGVSVCSDPSGQYGFDVAPDGLGGALIVWEDGRNGYLDIFAQHITPLGAADWDFDGTAVCLAAYSQRRPVIGGDGKGGAVIAWEDYRNGQSDIFAQRFNAFGGYLWTEDGIVISGGVAEQDYPQIAVSDLSSYFISWRDDRDGDQDIRVQKLSSTGTDLWTPGGVIACSSDGDSGAGFLVPDGSGGVMAAWTDNRDGNSDIYAARILSDGTMGWEPSLDAAADLPDDEGGWVRLAVSAPTHDNAGVDYLQVTGYNIWRRVSAAAGPLGTSSGAMNIYGSPPGILFEEASNPGDILKAPAAIDYDFPPGDWESIGYAAARQLPSYFFAVPTRSDSTSDGIPWEHYVVTIHTTDPAYYFIVGPDSAYSVDNLAPAQPLGLAGEALEGPPGVELTWDPNAEADISHYAVYRGSNEFFLPARFNHLGDTADPLFIDEYDGWYESWYKIAAIDRHGNMSTLAIIGPEGMATGDDPMPMPEATFLAQNWPNPFNPSTTISFGLKSGGHVSLRIFDAAGRLVTTLVDESRTAGDYTVEWNGKAGNGMPAASGIYFYRLKTTEFEETKKMVLLR
jgi:hypothetical protein